MAEIPDTAYFASATGFCDWLKEHGKTERELWVGYYKKGSGKPSMTWEESVDEALCFGWIDGLRKSVDMERYKIRFTPRRPKSNWSAVNINRVQQLEKEGRMQPEGMAVFEKRRQSTSNQHSQSQQHDHLDTKYETTFRRKKAAWRFFQELAPSYRRISIRWVMSAKREETRLKRLDILIQSSADKNKIPPLQR